MKVIMISTDSRIWEENSAARKRMREYASLFEKLVVVIVGREKRAPAEEGSLRIEEAGSRLRLIALWRAYKTARRVIREVHSTGGGSTFGGKADPAALGGVKSRPFDFAQGIKSKVKGRPSINLGTDLGGEVSRDWVVSTQDPFETGLVGWMLKRQRIVAGWQAQIHTDWLSPYFKRESWKNAVRVWLARRILLAADGVRVVSKRIKDSLNSEFLISNSKIGVLPILVEIGKMDSRLRGNEKKRREENKFIVLVVSRLTKEKNVGMAVEAIAKLKVVLNDQAQDVGVELVIVGEGVEKSKIKNQSEKLGIDFELVGWQEDLGPYFERADVYALTSNYEGYGRTVIEAMRSRVPVVMTDVGVAGEIVKNGENGIVVPVGDSGKLAEAISGLIEKPEERERLAEAGWRTVKARQTKEEYLAEYRRLVEKSVRVPRVLFITQKIDRDDDVLGVYHEWARRIAERLGGLKVICLERGRVELPEEMEIFSLGKEAARSAASGKSVKPKVHKVIRRLKYIFRLGRCLWRWRGEYDTVFVHMNPEYLVVAGWWWKITGKRVVFWYNHPRGGWRARVAAWFADRILATSPQSWAGRRGATIMPAGINVESKEFEVENNTRGGKEFKILSLGRIAPVKKLEILIGAIRELLITNYELRIIVDIFGGAREEDEDYFKRLKLMVGEFGLEDRVKFLGAAPNRKTPEIYQQYDIFVNLTPAGSLDKTILEAFAAGAPVITSNPAVRELYPEWAQNIFIFEEGDVDDLARALSAAANVDGRKMHMLGLALQKEVIRRHSLEVLVERLAEIF